MTLSSLYFPVSKGERDRIKAIDIAKRMKVFHERRIKAMQKYQEYKSLLEIDLDKAAQKHVEGE